MTVNIRAECDRIITLWKLIHICLCRNNIYFSRAIFFRIRIYCFDHLPPLEIVSTLPATEAELLQSEQDALLALSKLLRIWYSEAGLHGMLRSLDATLAQCHAIRDEFATESEHLRRDAERGAISQHLNFMLSLCAD